MNRFILLLTLIYSYSNAQNFSQKDTLRGFLSPDRSWFDVTYYHLTLEVDTDQKTIKGFNDIRFTVLENSNRMQLDLVENLTIDRVLFKGISCNIERLYDSFFVELPSDIEVGSNLELRIFYHGIPKVAKNAPWDGGFVWSKDKSGLPWIGVACQGLGASSWWPCKDHLSDEPDSMRITCTTPSEVQFIGNGNLESDFIEKELGKVPFPIYIG